MLADALDPDYVGAYVSALRDRVADTGAERLAEEVSADHGVDPAAAASAADVLMKGLEGAETKERPAQGIEPFLPRDVVESLIQTTVEQRLRDNPDARFVPPTDLPPDDPRAAIGGATRALLDTTQFGPEDLRWISEIAKAVAVHLARGTHPFNPEPAEHEVRGDARLVLVSDWGTGSDGAKRVAAAMRVAIDETLAAHREVHVIHLGDVYYSGDKGEYKRRMLAPDCWPVTAELADRGVTSWSLNGNHDMYSGGWAYFKDLLGDPRFDLQRSGDGKPTSWLRLFTQGGWDIVGLDTAWSKHPLEPGHRGLLEAPQGDRVAEWTGAEGRRTVLLSHHQLLSSYRKADESKALKQAIAPALGTGQVAGWIWGHEHLCMTFKPTPGVPFSCCIGNGGVPVAPIAPGDVPEPGDWVYRDVDQSDGGPWGRHAFAILDLEDDRMELSFRSDAGDQVGKAKRLP